MKLIGKIMGRFSKKNSTVGSQLALDEKFSNNTGHFFNDKAEIVSLEEKYSRKLSNDLWGESIELFS
ncbi:hypothetical protein [Dehalobacter sp. TBBPA1]|uniref:hypothetical protein n=1 Tax=Dehalobacter sp. TBBPA1 TaxID=3235037 RepID=UPI0034A3A4DA